MDTHKNARLTPKGREEMVRAVVDRSMSKAAAARGSCAVRGSMVFGAPSIKFPVSQKILMEGRCQVGTRLIRRMRRYGTEVRRTSLASLADAVAHRRGSTPVRVVRLSDMRRLACVCQRRRSHVFSVTPRSRSLYFCTFPLSVVGSSRTNSRYRGIAK